MSFDPREALRRRRAEKRSPWFILFGVVVGLLVATAAGVYLYDRLSDRRDKSRIQTINEEWFDGYEQYSRRWRQLDSDPRLAAFDAETKRLTAELDRLEKRAATLNVTDAEWNQIERNRERLRESIEANRERKEQAKVQIKDSDPESKDLRRKLYDLEEERRAIRRRHPEWPSPPKPDPTLY